MEKDNLQPTTGVAFAVVSKKLPFNARLFPRLSAQVLRDNLFHGMSLCQAMWPNKMSKDPHLACIDICYDGPNMRFRHIQAGVLTYFFHLYFEE